MILVHSKSLLYLAGLILLIIIPVMLLPIGYLPLDYIPFVFALLLLEIAIYVSYLRIGNWTTPLFPLIILSLLMALLRAVLCVVSLMLLDVIKVPPVLAESPILYLWLGNPISIILQIVLMCLLLPHFLIDFAPGLLGEKIAQFFEKEQSGTTVPSFREHRVVLSQMTPGATIYNVYSFPELEAQISKCIGLEGFLIYTDEGLIVWRHLNLNIDTERLVVRLYHLSENMKQSIGAMGLAHTNKIIVETDEHLIFNGFVDSVFGFVLIFNVSIPEEEINRRIDLLSESIKVFLKTRYATFVLSRAERYA